MVKIDNIQLPEFPLLLAPMEDVSDPPFRAVCKDNGADLMYTEFISSEGLIRDAIKSRKKLDIFDYERPVGIQIFGGDEESLALAAKIVEVTNPDLLDAMNAWLVLVFNYGGLSSPIFFGAEDAHQKESHAPDQRSPAPQIRGQAQP